MLIEMKFNAKVLETTEKEYDINGQKVKGYNLSILTDDGACTIKTNKSVYELFVNQQVKPMDKCVCLAVYDPNAVKKEVRVVGLANSHSK